MSRTSVAPDPAIQKRKEIEAVLKDLGFTCGRIGRGGTVFAEFQCVEGSRSDPVYGTIEAQFVNFFPPQNGEVKLEGYVYPSTAAALESFGVVNQGDDGTGFGTVYITGS